jgi:hypothetical protein
LYPLPGAQHSVVEESVSPSVNLRDAWLCVRPGYSQSWTSTVLITSYGDGWRWLTLSQFNYMARLRLELFPSLKKLYFRWQATRLEIKCRYAHMQI